MQNDPNLDRRFAAPGTYRIEERDWNLQNPAQPGWQPATAPTHTGWVVVEDACPNHPIRHELWFVSPGWQPIRPDPNLLHDARRVALTSSAGPSLSQLLTEWDQGQWKLLQAVERVWTISGRTPALAPKDQFRHRQLGFMYGLQVDFGGLEVWSPDNEPFALVWTHESSRGGVEASQEHWICAGDGSISIFTQHGGELLFRNHHPNVDRARWLSKDLDLPQHALLGRYLGGQMGDLHYRHVIEAEVPRGHYGANGTTIPRFPIADPDAPLRPPRWNAANGQWERYVSGSWQACP